MLWTVFQPFEAPETATEGGTSRFVRQTTFSRTNREHPALLI